MDFQRGTMSHNPSAVADTRLAMAVDDHDAAESVWCFAAPPTPSDPKCVHGAYDCVRDAVTEILALATVDP
jgi:hypothetical protein